MSKGELLTTIRTKKINGKNRLKVQVWKFTRGGSKSPCQILYKYRGRWITPYEQKLRWVKLDLAQTFSIFLQRLYVPRIKDMLFTENPLLASIKKHDSNTFQGKLLPIPLITRK